MTHRKWTSDDQEEWLKARLSLFTEAQAQKTTTSEFFPKVLTEWRKAWPVPEPTADEIAQAKNVEDAIKKKRTRDDDVRQYPSVIHADGELTQYIASKDMVP